MAIVQSLCGFKSKLWDDKLSWNNTCGFDLSICFQETILLLIPVLFITVGAPCDLFMRWSQLSRRSIKYLSLIKKLNILEFSLSLVILGLSFIELGTNVTMIRRHYQTGNASSISTIQWLSPLLMSYAIVYSLIMSLLYKRIGLNNSGVMFTFWLLLTIKTILTSVSILRWEWHNFIPNKTSANYQSALNEIHLNHDKFRDQCGASWDHYFGLIDYRSFKIVQVKLFLGPLVLVQMILSSLRKFNWPHGEEATRYLNADDEYELIQEDKSTKIDLCPARTSSIFSWITFNWLNDLIVLGNKKKLEKSDLVGHAVDFRLVTRWREFSKNLGYSVNKAFDYRADRIDTVKKIRANLKRPVRSSAEIELLIKQLRSKLNPIDFDYLLNESKASDPDVVNQLESVESSPKYVSLFWIIMNTYKWQFAQCFSLRIISTCLQFTIPFTLDKHIDFLTHPGIEPVWHGWIYIIALILPNLLGTVVDLRDSYVLQIITVDMTNCIRLAMYKKTVNLSVFGNKNVVSGTIINMLAIDVDRVVNFIRTIDVVVIGPFRILIAICLLYSHFGLSSLGTIPVILLMLPYNYLVGKIMRPIIVNSINLKDFRMKLVTELFNAIRIIKIYGWENSFMKRILNIRIKEAYYIKIDGILMTFQMFQYTFFPTILMIAVFAIYSYTGSSPPGSPSGLLSFLPGGGGLSETNSTTLHQGGETGGPTYDHILTTNRIFVGTTLFAMITAELSSLSHPMSSFFIFLVALKRLNHFLEREERPASEAINQNSKKESLNDEDPVTGGDTKRRFHDSNAKSQSDICIRLTGANFRWDSKVGFELADINLSIPRGKLVAIVGRVGSGKSSLLSAILGNIELIGGRVDIDKRARLGYVPQEAWILNDTIINNICIGQPFVRAKYDRIIEACALQADFDTFPLGDKSEIGEKGLNLSGGQKQRIALARAIYMEAEIFLMDDPLSAVDAHVAKHLFDNVIANREDSMTATKTRVLVTNKLSILPNVDYIYTMNDGRIIEAGSCLQLLRNKSHFARLYLNHYLLDDHTSDGADSLNDETLTFTDKEQKLISEEIRKLEKITRNNYSIRTNGQLKSNVISIGESRHDDSNDGDDDDHSPEGESIQMRKKRRNAVANLKSRLSIVSLATSTNSSNIELARRTAEHKPREEIFRNLTEQDDIETTITPKDRNDIYWLIVKTFGFKGWGSILLIIVASGFMIGSNVWLARWSNDSQDKANDGNSALRNLRVITFVILRIADCGANFFGTCLLGFVFIKLSLSLHANALSSVLDAPMSWFDCTPVGRLLNIFSNDVEIVDDQIRMAVIMLVINGTSMVASFIIVSLGSYYTILVTVPVVIAFVVIYIFYIPTSRQLERINLATTAPIFSHFNETLDGLTTIRAFKMDDYFLEEFNCRLKDNNVSRYLYFSSLRWFDFRLRSLSLLIIFTVTLVSILTMGSTTPGIAALTISYALTMAPGLGALIELWSSFQTELISVERIRQYAKVASERLLFGQRPEESFVPSSNLSQHVNEYSWPDQGEIEFDSYSARYRPELDLVLRNVSFKVKAGEKIGLVGRTGAGKSSIMLAIFRIFEAVEGRILIDNVDIGQMDLRYLRSRISIIPQEPILFTGCIRQNVDPTEEHTDAEIWAVIKLAHLEEFVKSLPKGLDQEVSQAGSNFSVGQKQLFCLARAILRRSKILLLDEATAAVDLVTDELIQKTIKKEFSRSTILTIAHRLETIMDYDRVFVIDQGQIVESDQPANLLKRKQSKFYSLAKEDGLV